MMFEATVRDADGLRRTVRREAASASAFAAALRADGLLVLDVAEVRGTADCSGFTLRRLLPMTGFDVETGVRQLAAMIRSGVTLLMALETVEEQASCPAAAAAWRRVRGRIVRGGTLSGALAEEGGRFGEMLVRLAEVGERSGELEHALVRAADQLEARRDLRATVANALVYPAVTVLMAVGVSAFLVMAVIPKIGDFLASGGVDLPPLTQALLDVSDWLRANGMKIVVGALGAVAAVSLARLSAVGREAEDLVLLRLPVIGRILRLSGTALFARAMQILTESGVTLLDALETAGALMMNRRLRRRVREARGAVMRGRTLADALGPAREFLPMLARMAAVGEVTGSLPDAFGETARFHEVLLARTVRRFGMLIEPVMICVTGLIVGFVYIAFFLALFAIAGTK